MNFKLGKREAKQDDRNIQFKAILPIKLAPPPPEFDVDFDRQDIWPLPMPLFGNDKWGDCVMAARANQTLRFEKFEQAANLPITDDDVLREYWSEQGDPTGTKKPDEGLYVLDSLKAWRSQGWQAAGQKYNIYAFAQINKSQQDDIMQAIYLLSGAISGVNLYQADMDAIDKRQVWDTTSPPGECVGGHCMMVLGYTRSGVVFLTWGQRQPATWDWVLNRLDEIYGVCDDRDSFLGDKSPVDTDKLDAILKEITV